MLAVETTPDLPIPEILPALDDALNKHGMAVVVAPPGAGKTTMVPLHLLGSCTGKIILIEPRRIAARSAARRMAFLHGDQIGETIGYTMRLDTKTSAQTRIIAVTEGVFTRMIMDDPELNGIDCVIFDEFHERALEADFGLALALDVREGLREDLKLIVMSATLDGAAVAELMRSAPVIESKGRAFPIDIHYKERARTTRIEDAVADAVLTYLARENGSQLVFLPGMGEIRRVATRLEGRLPKNAQLHVLHGSLSAAEQDAAIKPTPQDMRKIVLASAIAESAITIDGVRVVIDSGLQRVPVYEPASGLTRLETVKVSLASANQRAGRAGRTAPGIAVRLWRAEQNAALSAFNTPEIMSADLAGLVLDCLAFGVTEPQNLRFLNAPPEPALNQARNLLSLLGALDDQGQLTAIGKKMRAIPLPPRLAAMVAKTQMAGDTQAILDAALFAVLMTERGFGGDDVDLMHRFDAARRDRSARGQAAQKLASCIAGQKFGKAHSFSTLPDATCLLNAFPDRVAEAKGERGRFRLSGGRGANLEVTHHLAKVPFLIIADLQGAAQKTRIVSAIEISKADIYTHLGQHIVSTRSTFFDVTRGKVICEEIQNLGVIALGNKGSIKPQPDEANHALISAIQDYGLSLLNWAEDVAALRARLEFAHFWDGPAWPDVSDTTLLETLEHWLLPFMEGSGALAKINSKVLQNALKNLVPYDKQSELDQNYPTQFLTPAGSHTTLRYEAEDVVLTVKPQALYGLRNHPMIGGSKNPKAILIEFISPAGRPIQTTRDLPGFWQGSWRDVRIDMKGRYPKHLWPEDPTTAAPTLRAKPRGT